MKRPKPYKRAKGAGDTLVLDCFDFPQDAKMIAREVEREILRKAGMGS